MARALTPDIDRMSADWTMLCETIGERLAGTDSERHAADYIKSSFDAAGCDDCRIEFFDCVSRRKATSSVEFFDGKKWERVDSQSMTGSASTRGGQTVEGEIVWLEMPEQGSRLKKNSLSGKIALLFGPMPDNVDLHKRLVAAKPLAVIHVDHRLPFSWAKSDGVFPLWTKKYGMPPTVSVPFTDAWRWRQTGVSKVRVSADITLVPATSTNIIADLKGNSPSDEMILLGAHHDTQANSVGADDNASGVVALLELARLLKPLKRRRTIRLVSFGTEEQLSVGSSAYVLKHRSELKSIVLMVNFDSFASPVGHTTMVCAGGADLAEFGLSEMKRRGVCATVKNQVIPYADHFPFSAFGVPALWFYRENFPGGRWQHHSRFDNLDNVSVSAASEIIAAAGGMIASASRMEQLPFKHKPSAAFKSQTRHYAVTLFGFDVK